jgi:RimJ/RimL family protein N-acetyltransferase
MTDARDHHCEDMLRNGLRVTIRAVRPDDRERLAKAFASLDRESVYTRFFAYKSELSAAELARIDAMDFVHEVMLVATVCPAGHEVVIAAAHYVEQPSTVGARSAELAFVVEEDYQGLGLAGRMLSHLIAIARQAGIGRLVAEVLPGNRPMLAVFARTGLPLRQQRGDGVVHVTMELGDRA